jgi:hypothetical protein
VVEQWPFKPKVVGSIPTAPTNSPFSFQGTANSASNCPSLSQHRERMGHPPMIYCQNNQQRNKRLKILLTSGVMLLSAVWVYGQTTRKPKPTLAPTKTQTVKKDPPTLGFNHIKDVSPITDDDAIHEEWKLEKELPGNEFVHDKRAMHETILMNEFIEGFKNSKECNGITFYLKSDKKPDFTVQINVMGHDAPKLGGQTWTWILGYPGDPTPVDSKSHGIGGMGNQSTAKLTARDVCLTIWDDLDPNHFKKPGGRIE